MIKRDIYNDLKEHLNKKEITLLVGPRQAGKTTLMLALRDFLISKKYKTVFINLDIEADKQYVTSQSNLIKKIELEIGKDKGFVFIDEMQRKENAGIFLKGIYDMNLPYKFIVSGSGSFELKEKIHESLAGRKRLFRLGTLSFNEFVNFKTDYKYEDRLSDFFEIEFDKAFSLFEEYISFGGYPRVVLEDRFAEKRKIIEDIYQSYIEKDIYYLLKIHKSEAFSNLVKVLASQIGQLINLSEMSATLGISIKTLKDYLWYLEKTFIIQRVTPFYKNKRKEITKSPVVYFYDLGLRNYLSGEFGDVKQATCGFLFQNFVFNILYKMQEEDFFDIHFWRTKEKAEVDFVIEKGNELIPIEVKYGRLKEENITRGLRSFIERYVPKRAYVINLSLEGLIKRGKTRVCSIEFEVDFLRIFWCDSFQETAIKAIVFSSSSMSHAYQH